jgi:hypothetical protein
VREWFLNYCEMLRSRALFVAATEVVKFSGDPGGEVGGVTRMGTDIFNSCPSCMKPLHNENNVVVSSAEGVTSGQEFILRSCSSCKKKLSMCGLCHDPVKKRMAFCIGCSHGFHLEHAKEWFSKNTMCPTGCGHQCVRQQGSMLPMEMSD